MKHSAHSTQRAAFDSSSYNDDKPWKQKETNILIFKWFNMGINLTLNLH